MGVKQGDAAYKMSPVFRHFAERHVLKFDYNEKDRLFKLGKASAGLFMRPKRFSPLRTWRRNVFRLAMAKTALKLSVKAVAEALANDLTRIAGIPAQELTIVRGQYSDGYPKLMVQAAFAEDYKNLGNGYLADGQIVPPQGGQVESLGRYKAFFLAIADRDAIGFNGKNKGFAKGRFFAIDAGHSLEGNSRFLQVYDNMSFRDACRFSFTPRFSNFSVFDDDTRFAKFKGMLDLRALKASGKIERLFAEYALHLIRAKGKFRLPKRSFALESMRKSTKKRLNLTIPLPKYCVLLRASSSSTMHLLMKGLKRRKWLSRPLRISKN